MKHSHSERLFASGCLSFAKSIFLAAEAKMLFDYEFFFASTVSAYYCLFQLGSSAMLAYSGYSEPQDTLVQGILREHIAHTPSSNESQLIEDPARNIGHGAVQHFLVTHVLSVGQQFTALKQMREFVDYGPRLRSSGRIHIVWTGCEYKPNDFIAQLKQHLHSIPDSFHSVMAWFTENSYDDVHCRILSSDFVLHEFDAIRPYHAYPVARKAWSSYRQLCERLGVDWKEYRPDPGIWHSDEQSTRTRYHKLIESLT